MCWNPILMSELMTGPILVNFWIYVQGVANIHFQLKAQLFAILSMYTSPPLSSFPFKLDFLDYGKIDFF